MPISDRSTQLEDALDRFAWEEWAQMGIFATAGLSRQWAQDPEALLRSRSCSASDAHSDGSEKRAELSPPTTYCPAARGTYWNGSDLTSKLPR
jgi:hypothetical protein